MYSITFTSKEAGSTVRAQDAFETLRKATSYAKKLSATFADVVVWNGQPGGERAYECDAERFGDRCAVCAPSGGEDWRNQLGKWPDSATGDDDK